MNTTTRVPIFHPSSASCSPRPRCLAEGSISPETFDAQVLRLTREELEPRGYHLLVRELPDGAPLSNQGGEDGTVCEMWEHSPVFRHLEHSPEKSRGLQSSIRRRAVA